MLLHSHPERTHGWSEDGISWAWSPDLVGPADVLKQRTAVTNVANNMRGGWLMRAGHISKLVAASSVLCATLHRAAAVDRGRAGKRPRSPGAPLSIAADQLVSVIYPLQPELGRCFYYTFVYSASRTRRRFCDSVVRPQR